jgi:glycosyltransferase involved in cell wall biosynthesis
VIVAENIPHGDVLRAWQHATLAVVPSRWPDPCPLVVLEAMAAGKPVIASRIGGIPDLVADGTTGLLVPPEDASGLRASIERLLSDGELRARMGQAALERAKTYSATTLVPQIESVYREVIAGAQLPVMATRAN